MAYITTFQKKWVSLSFSVMIMWIVCFELVILSKFLVYIANVSQEIKDSGYVALKY